MEILLFILYIILLLCPILIALFEPYEKNLRSHVASLVNETSLSFEKQEELTLEFLNTKNNYFKLTYIPKIAKPLMVILILFNSFFSVYTPDEALELIILVSIMIIAITMIVLMLAYFVTSSLTSSKTTSNFSITIEDLLANYFKHNYPDIASILIPIYTTTSLSKPNRNLSHFYYHSRFIVSLETFIFTFEQSIKEPTSKAVFKYDLLESDKVELFAKLIVILSDPLLIEEAVYEEGSPISKEFNTELENCMDYLSKKVTTLQKIGSDLAKKELLLYTQTTKNNAKERFELLVKQNFDSIT